MIIAEFCQNWLGDKEILKDMVFSAKAAGATFAKIQSFFAKDLSVNFQSDYERLKSLELPLDEHHLFTEWCREAQITPMTSIYSSKYLEPLKRSGFNYFKIGSAQAANNERLIDRAFAYGEVVLSTGGRDEKGIYQIPIGQPYFAVLHCVSKYPCAPDSASILRMAYLKDIFIHAKHFGFSSHVDPTHPQGLVPLKLASYLMVNEAVHEVHYTMLDRSKTKDGPVSVTFDQLKEVCEFDKLSKNDQRAQYPFFGMIYCPQDEKEIATIKHYEGRWAPT